MNIPLSTAGITEAERKVVNNVLDSGDLKGGGKYWKRANQIIESEFGGSRAMLTTSCTHALEMAAILLEIRPGDEVILPSYTFPSTATAFARRGASIRFCEITPATLTMDPGHLLDLITTETKAVVPVHYAGVACDMDRITSIAADYDAVVVEDAAQGVDASYKNKPLGTIGDIGCYSFHETKSYSAGEGGALILNDDQYVERAEFILHKGTNYAKFSRGEVDRYTWVDVGSSYAPSEMQAALACAQLERREEIRTARKEIYELYNEELTKLDQDGHLELPLIPDDRTTNYHIYWILTENNSIRNDLMSDLRQQGIGAASHYEPLHTAKMGRQYGYTDGDLPQTEELAGCLLRLPIYEQMDYEDILTVVRGIREFYYG